MPPVHPRYFTNWRTAARLPLTSKRVVGPGVGYTTGKGYYLRNPNGNAALSRPAAAVAAARTPTKTKPPQAGGLQGILSQYFSSFQTPKQVRAQATTDINTQINAGLAGIKSAYEQQQAELAAQQERAHGFASVLMGMQGDAAKAAQGAYQESADRLRAYGTGLTGATQQAMQAEADKASAGVAQQTGGLGQLTGGYDIPGLASTGNYLGVVVPGRALEEQSAAAYGLGQSQQAARAWGLEHIATDYGDKLNAVNAELAQKKAELLATRPDLYSKEIAQLTDAQRQNLAVYLSALSLNPKLANTKSLINSRTASTAIAKKKLTLAQQAAQRATDAERGWQVVNGKRQPLPGYKWGPGGPSAGVTVKTYKPTKGSAGAAGKKLTPSQVQALQNNVRGTVGKVVSGAPFAKVIDPGDPASGIDPVYKPLLGYKKARQKLVSLYVTPLGLKQGPVLNSLLAIIDSWLSKVGIVPPPRPPQNPPGAENPARTPR